MWRFFVGRVSRPVVSSVSQIESGDPTYENSVKTYQRVRWGILGLLQCLDQTFYIVLVDVSVWADSQPVVSQTEHDATRQTTSPCLRQISPWEVE